MIGDISGLKGHLKALLKKLIQIQQIQIMWYYIGELTMSIETGRKPMSDINIITGSAGVFIKAAFVIIATFLACGDGAFADSPEPNNNTASMPNIEDNSPALFCLPNGEGCEFFMPKQSAIRQLWMRQLN